MKIDANWLKQHAAAMMIAVAVLCFALGHDPKVPLDWSHRFEIGFSVVALLLKVLFPGSGPQLEHVLKALSSAGLLPGTDSNPTTGSQSAQSDQQPLA